jgi:RHS repeat-associated protein
MMTDAAGQTSMVTYNAFGQVLTVTNPKNETTTNAYDSAGYLQSVTGPITGATTSYTYDSYGRIRTVTDSDGYTVTTDYDGLDRPTRVAYPDGTYEDTTYDRLDAVGRRDRLGRWTRLTVDALQRVLATRDPLGRTVTQQWCTCGALDTLVDAKGQRTSWQRDVQARVVQEVRADGVTTTSYAYEPASGRLHTLTDPKGQVTTYTYFADDAMASLSWSNAAVPTPPVSFTYEVGYPRTATMVDGTGTTSYTYAAAGTLGAGKIATVDGPLDDDTIVYAYDELGRVSSRTINGVGVDLTYDALGRVSGETNVLGTFTYGYDAVSARLASVSYPNGQTSNYSYLPTAQDHRLQTIHHKYPTGATLSKFDYTYDAVGNILTWRQQADSDPPVEWTYGYDAADQLTRAIKRATGTPATILSRYAYRYDPAGNRLSEQIDDTVTSATYDSLNRLVTQSAGGVVRVAGTVNEPATVTIDGQPASVDGAQGFAGSAAVASGTTRFSVEAADASGNTTTTDFQVAQAGTGKTFTFDANGNLTSDGNRTFEWDARNQLVAVNVGTHRSEFTYDGLERRIRVVEKDNGVAQSESNVVWCREEICEERAGDGATIVRRVFVQGEQISGANRYFATDHLGSVTAVTDGSVALVTRYDFDPSGRRAITAGVPSTSIGFTGHPVHAASGTYLTLYRTYDPDLARWISEDPLGFDAGPNFYAYVGNSLTTAIDPVGLARRKQVPPSRTRFCNEKESATCQATCRAQGKGVESCRVSQTFRIVRVTDQDGAVKTLRKWVDGPMSCSCTDPEDQPMCGQNCVKMLVVVGVLGSIAWVCLTRLPPPVPVW